MRESLPQAEQHFEHASSLHEQKDYLTALVECEAAIRLSPKFADAHNLRGMILDDLGRKAEAILAYREAIRADPQFKEAEENLQDAERELQESKHKAPNIEGKKFGIRAGAFIIDTIAQFITNYVAGLIGGLLLGVVLVVSAHPTSFDEQRLQVLSFISGVILSILYFTLFEGFYGASLGKLILGMRVVKTDGRPCDFGAAFVRAILRWIDGLVFGLVAYESMKQSPLQQRLGDKAAKTVVVGHKEAFIQNPHSLWLFLVAGVIYFIVTLLGTTLAATMALR